MFDRVYCVYILTNKSNTVLYTGVTNDMARRIYEHKSSANKGFASKYKANKLVYYEYLNDINAAIEFEKRIKGWRRSKKIDLINSTNPEWNDLSVDFESL